MRTNYLSPRELEMAENALRSVLAILDTTIAASGDTKSKEAVESRLGLIGLITKLYRMSGGTGDVF